jgi:hypothetical protein
MARRSNARGLAGCWNGKHHPAQGRPSDEAMSQADEYRQQAAECQEQAEKSLTAHDKQQWLKIACHWLKLAEAIEGLGPKD